MAELDTASGRKTAGRLPWTLAKLGYHAHVLNPARSSRTTHSAPATAVLVGISTLGRPAGALVAAGHVGTLT
jgi:hypothetical protein